MPQKSHGKTASHQEEAAKHHKSAVKHKPEVNHERAAQGQQKKGNDHAGKAPGKYAERAASKKKGDMEDESMEMEDNK